MANRLGPASPNRLLIAFGPALIVGVLGVVVLDSVLRLQRTNTVVAHTHEVIARGYALLGTMQDAETGQRGYIITGDSTYLGPYNSAVARIRTDSAALRTLIVDNAAQLQRFDSTAPLIRAKLDELAQSIAFRRDSGLARATAMVQTNHGKATMDSIRALVARMMETEGALLAQRQARDKARQRITLAIVVLGSLLAAWLAQRLNLRLILDRDRAEQANTELTIQAEKLEVQATELEAQTEELQLQTEELQTTSDELVLALREAEEANRGKSEFLAMMSHELRTPLNAIGGYADLMEIGVDEPLSATNVDYVHRIQSNQRHLLGLINSLLNYARIEAGAVSYKIADVNANTLLRDVEQFIEPQIRARGLEYDCTPGPEGMTVRADRDKAMQVLINLLSNAVKFTPAGGRVSLSATQVGNEASFRVHDTGIGIPADRLDAIFDPFVQVDSSHTRAVAGTGLGLAISRELARGMQGELRVESRVGEGSTFTLILPVARTV